jgi:hypothetical protein
VFVTFLLAIFEIVALKLLIDLFFTCREIHFMSLFLAEEIVFIYECVQQKKKNENKKIK